MERGDYDGDNDGSATRSQRRNEGFYGDLILIAATSGDSSLASLLGGMASR